MELNSCLLLLIISHITQGIANIKLFQDSKNWFEAHNYCLVQGGRLVSPDEMSPSTCTNESIWSSKYGNKRLTPWIAKIGCSTGREPKHSRPSLLDCYISCKSTTFGYKTPWCSCEEETRIAFTPDSTCKSPDRTHVWLYNKTDIQLRDDDYTMDCITAQCTEKGTIFRAVNCNSMQFAYCQEQGSSFTTTEKDTQANSETSCNINADHLISEQICLSPNTAGGRSEFWTGIQRYRYNTTEKLRGNERKEENSTDILNCVYVKCPIENGHGPIENTENCKERLNGFACIFNGTSENVTTVKLDHSSSMAPTTISSSNSFNIEPTSVTLELFSNQSSKHVVNASINTRSTPALPNNIYMSTTMHSLVVQHKKVTESWERSSMYNSTTRNSTFSRTQHLNTVHSSFETSPEPTIITSSESRSLHFDEISTNESPKSSVETSLWKKSSVLMHTQSNIESSILQTSVLMHTQSKKESSILQTSATSELSFIHASKHVLSLTTISKSHIKSNIDMSTTVYSSVVKSTSLTESSEINTMHNTTTRNQNNNSRSQQLSTGLIVGISVSILCLVVLIIGVFGICRCRNQRAFKEKSLEFPTPIDTNYHDIDFHPKKKTNVIENDPTHHVVSSKDDDMPFRLTDNTSNGKTNKPNDAYAVVVKKPVTTKADNTSNGKTTKSNNAHDAYAVVVKIPRKNQNKDEKTSLDIPESNNDSMNQTKPISGNESGNIYDTSIGYRDGSDPTYNTTTHKHTSERANESDYDQF